MFKTRVLFFISFTFIVNVAYGGNFQLVNEYGYSSSPIHALIIGGNKYIYVFNAVGKVIICNFENKNIIKQYAYHSSKYRAVGLSKEGKLLLPTADKIYNVIDDGLNNAMILKFPSSLSGQPIFAQKSVLFQIENRTLVWHYLENLKTKKLAALSDYSHVYYSDQEQAFYIAKERSIYRLDEATGALSLVFSCSEYIHSFIKVKDKYLYHVSTGIYTWSEGTITQIYKRKSSSLSDALSKIIFSPAKDRFVILFGNNQAKMCEINGNELYGLPGECLNGDISFTPKGSFFYTIISGNVFFYSTSTGEKFSGLERCSDVNVLLVSDDEENLSTGHESGLIRQWEIFKDTISEPGTFEDITDDPLIGEFVWLE